MKTKNMIYGLVMAGVMTFGSCSDFTDVEPKGKNLLTTTDQLEMLLNGEIDFEVSDMTQMCGDMIRYTGDDVPTQISLPGVTRDVVMWTWDEANQDKMAEQTSEDTQYSALYGYIGTICNPVLNQVDDAEGTDAKKNQLKCEALVLRAYCHYLLVNKFAKAYNPATASTDRGVIVMTEDKDISTPQEQSTVKEVYDQILKDCNEAIEIDGLPTIASNRMRMSKPCAYAVKAMALLSMQEWSDAEAAAKQALELNSTVNNYNDMMTAVYGYYEGGTYEAVMLPLLECEEDLFFSYNAEYADAISPEAKARIEPGNVALEKIASLDMLYDYLIDAASYTMGLEGYTITYDTNSGWNAGGLKTTTMYLVVAEAEIHNGNITAAMEALDAIRQNRISPDVYAPLAGSVTTQTDAISYLKMTSAGEGLYTVWNFINRKRWNQVSGWEETFTRTIGTETYTLTPESPLWIFPIPQNAINNNPNLKQNYK